MADPIKLPPGYALAEDAADPAAALPSSMTGAPSAAPAAPPMAAQSDIKLPPGYELIGDAPALAAEPATPPGPSVADKAADAGKMLGVGAIKGILGIGSLPGLGEWLVRKGIDMGSSRLGLGDPKLSTAPEGERSTFLGMYDDYKNDLERRLDWKLPDPKTKVGEYAQTVGEFAPAGLRRGAQTIVERLNAVLFPAVGSEAAGQAVKEAEGSPYQEAAARVAGAVAGGMAPAIFRRVVTPAPQTNQEYTNALQTLEQEGVPLTAGRRTGSRAINWAESHARDVPFAGDGAQTSYIREAEGYTRAALRRAGEENAPRATPQVLTRIDDRLGQQFGDLSRRNNIPPMDPVLSADLRQVRREYFANVNRTARRPYVEDTIADINRAMAQGGLSGEAYQAMRTRLNRIINQHSGGSGDVEYMMAARGMREALDDAMERSILNNPNPTITLRPNGVQMSDADLWRETRRQYRNYLALRETVGGHSGQDAAQGLITPTQLSNALHRQDAAGYSLGRGDLAELARAGRTVLERYPNSGTPARQLASQAMSLGMGAGGITAIPGIALHLGAQALGARTVMSPWMQRYMSNQNLTPFQQYLQAGPIMSRIPGIQVGAQDGAFIGTDN